MSDNQYVGLWFAVACGALIGFGVAVCAFAWLAEVMSAYVGPVWKARARLKVERIEAQIAAQRKFNAEFDR